MRTGNICFTKSREPLLLTLCFLTGAREGLQAGSSVSYRGGSTRSLRERSKAAVRAGARAGARTGATKGQEAGLRPLLRSPTSALVTKMLCLPSPSV